MSDYILVNYGHIEESANSIASLGSRIQSALEELRQAVAPLAETWEGTAASDFQVKLQQASQKAADIPVKARAMASAAHECNANHQQTEARTTGIWS